MNNLTDDLNDFDPDLIFFNSFNDTSLSNYCTLQEYSENSLMNKNAYNYLVLNFNIRSFLANCSQFEAFLECLPECPDILILTETWNTAQNLDLCRIEGYGSAHTFRSQCRGGGVSIFVSNRSYFEKITA